MDAAPTAPDPAEDGPAGEQGAPPVVAVVVTSDPGWWLEECLASLAAQDYPELSVLVVDAGSVEDPTARVAAVMPGAYVRRVRRRRGFATAGNEVLGVVEGASHYLFCHDDVALDPSAVRLMIEEAFRSNAGILAPKLVGWFASERLLAVGMGVDSFGVPVALVDRGELDQQQHDVVRDVFYAPSACSLVRADLFASIGGFDGGFGLVGEDVDLAWRAHLAGARTVTVPAARVRHLEVTESGQRAADGSLRAVGSDARERAAGVGFGLAMFPEAGHADAGAPAPAGDHPPDGERQPDQEPAVEEPPPADPWDLRRWDEEDDAVAAAASAGAAGHHTSWRARRDAERGGANGSWVGDEDDWGPVPRAARRRRAPGDVAPTSRPGDADPPRGPDADALDAARAAARVRVVVCDCSAPRLASRLPPLFALTLVEAVVRARRDGAASARQPLRAWRGLIRQSGAIRARRAAVRRARVVPEREALALQVRGVSRLRPALRSPGAVEAAVPWDSDRRLGVTVWVAVLAVLAYGSRQLLVGHLPTVGELAPWPSLGALVRTATSGWRATGLGTSAAAPTLFGLLSLLGALLLGHTTLLEHVLVLGMLPLGALGAARLARPLASRRASLAALVVYLAVPLPYNALADGRWDGLVAYGAMPWVLGLLLRGMGAPFDHPLPPDANKGRVPRPLLSPARRVVALALVTALAGSVEPGMLPLVVAVGAALALGSLLAGSAPAGLRALVMAAAAALGAALLLFPWSIGWLPPVGEWATFTRAASSEPITRLPALLRFETGPLGAGVLGYAVLIVAAFPLVVGREWRSGWAVRMWVVALTSFGVAWAGQHHALGLGWPPAEVLLAPAAAAVALAAGLGVAAFEVDLSGYVFGWRQVASVVTAAAAVLACLPVLAMSVNGRWREPVTGFDSFLSWMPPGDYRVLWLGDPAVLPIAGWRVGNGLAYATSRDGGPVLTDDWPGTSRGATRLLAQAVTLARHGQTSELGHLLAPMAVRYVVVVDQASPADTLAIGTRPVPADLTAGLQSQLDLQMVDNSDGAAVYENDAWAPLRFVVPPAAVAAAKLDDPRVARTTDLAGATPVLGSARPPTSFAGPLPAGSAVEVAEAPSSHWHLRAGGVAAPRQGAFGSSNVFDVAAGGAGSLHYATPLGWWLALVVEVAAWVAALAVVVRGRRRPGRPADDEGEAVPHDPIVLVGAAR